MLKSDNGGESPTSAPLSDVERAIRELGDEIEAYTDEMINSAKRPDVLLHFTDSAGLMGIPARPGAVGVPRGCPK